MKKYYTVYAGVNGAGKTTMYNARQELSEINRVNPDEVLREFGGDWRKENDQYKAGKIALTRMNAFLDNGDSFSQETTLSTKFVINQANKAKELGYLTEMHYVSLNSADIAIERIRNRVSKGGHGIPEDLVRRRYERSLQNLKSAIKAFDIVFVYDNSENFRNIATFYRGEMIDCVDNPPEWFKKALN